MNLNVSPICAANAARNNSCCFLQCPQMVMNAISRLLLTYPAPGSGSGVVASEMNNKSVVGTLLRNIVEISEHFATEVRQDESLRLDLCPVPQDVRVVQVESHGFAEEIAFGD